MYVYKDIHRSIYIATKMCLIARTHLYFVQRRGELLGLLRVIIHLSQKRYRDLSAFMCKIM
jgi:hypothetical protein